MSKRIDLGISDWSDYGKATEWMRHQVSYSRPELVAYIRSLGNTIKRAGFCATTLLSPRLVAHRKNADCRGAVSNPWGHLAYNHKLNRKTIEVNGKKKLEKQRFSFRYRAEALPVLKRVHKITDSHKIPTNIETPVTTPPVTETV